MKLDLLVKGGHVIDPARNVDEIQDIGVVANRIVPADGCGEAMQTVDARGCYVFPGLIDFHAHLFYSGGMTPVSPDLLLATGVTAAVDAGTSGCGNFDAFYRTEIVHSHLRIKCFLNVCSGGLADEAVPENFNPALFNEDGIRRVLQRYPERVLGLKIRMGREMVDDITPMREAVGLSKRLGGLSICVHPTCPPCSCGELAELLRPGDIFCHVYHGRGSHILEDGVVRPEILKARARGVLFDVANGRGNFCHEVALAAIQQGFLPDIISTDIGKDKLGLSRCARSLPFVMSKLISMGIPLREAVQAVTQTPAELMGEQHKLGTLEAGAYADIAVFKLESRQVPYLDSFGRTYQGDCLLIPQLTISDGEVVFAQADFGL